MTIIERSLAILARRVVRAYKPKIIGITGSVGKTSVRNAVKIAIGESRNVRVAKENYNNEFGLPLTILGEDSQGKSLFGWIGVMWRGFLLGFGMAKGYPEWLVLEYGADKKGDILHLTSIARPFIAVVTAVGLSHAEFFGTIDDVKEEKGVLVRAVGESGVVVLNADDDATYGMRHMANGGVVTYGFRDRADISAKNIDLKTRHDGDIAPDEIVSRLKFDLDAGNDVGNIELVNVLGDAHVLSVLAGASVALQVGLSVETICKNLRAYTPMPGRMRLIGGIKHSLIFDDTYNASSPRAVHFALDVLGSFSMVGDTSRIAVLGDMLELGRYSEAKHIEIGKHVASLPIDLLVCVGQGARDIARGALSSGMDQGRVFTYANSEDAGRFVQDRMHKGDVILVKGSQGVRMEKVVKEIMAEPLLAPELIVRQNETWLNK